MEGYVYVMKNESLPNTYKIGGTVRDPEVRAKELSNTSVPTPYKVICSQKVNDWWLVEKEIHKALSEFRVSSNREFFSCDLKRLLPTFFIICNRMHPLRYYIYTDNNALHQNRISREISQSFEHFYAQSGRKVELHEVGGTFTQDDEVVSENTIHIYRPQVGEQPPHIIGNSFNTCALVFVNAKNVVGYTKYLTDLQKGLLFDVRHKPIIIPYNINSDNIISVISVSKYLGYEVMPIGIPTQDDDYDILRGAFVSMGYIPAVFPAVISSAVGYFNNKRLIGILERVSNTLEKESK